MAVETAPCGHSIHATYGGKCQVPICAGDRMAVASPAPAVCVRCGGLMVTNACTCQHPLPGTPAPRCPSCGLTPWMCECEPPAPACDCIASGNTNKPKQHGADPHAKNCAVYRTPWPPRCIRCGDYLAAHDSLNGALVCADGQAAALRRV